MIMNFDDIHSGHIEGYATLEVKKAEFKVLPSGLPIFNVNYRVIEGTDERTGQDVTGEFISHTFFLPSSKDDAGKTKTKKAMLKRDLAAHGIELSGDVTEEDIVNALNGGGIAVRAKLVEDDYQSKKGNPGQTKIKSFYAA